MKTINISFFDRELNLLLQQSFPLSVGFYKDLKIDRPQVFSDLKEEVLSRLFVLLKTFAALEEVNNETKI